MFESIGPLLHHSLRKFGVKKQVDAVQILDIAHKVLAAEFGDDIFQYIQPKYIQAQHLVLSHTSSVAAQEIRLRQEKILRAINQSIPKSYHLQGIRFVS